MEDTPRHKLDTSIDATRAIDSLTVRDQLVLRTALPPVVPRLGESLLTMVNQPSSRLSGDAAPLESYLVMDANHAVKKLKRWRDLLPRVKPFFAIKCNPDPVLIKTLVVAGDCGFDCASLGEISSVLNAGGHPARIIYANPNKAPDAIARSLSLGVTTMTFDSVAELRKIRSVLDAGDVSLEPPDLVLRLRVPDDHSVFKLGSKFGAEPLQVRSLLAAALEVSLRVVGISFHCGSGCYDATAFVVALRLARQAFDIGASMGITMTLVDMGGGFPGLDGEEEVTDDEGSDDEMPTVFSRLSERPQNLALRRDLSRFKEELHMIEVARQVGPALDELFPVDGPPVSIISEPGRYFVEGASELFLNVFESTELRPGQAIPGKTAGEDLAAEVVAPEVESEPVTLWFVNEGTLGCFKDIVLSEVKFEPELVTPGIAPLAESATATPNTSRSRSNTNTSEFETRPRGISEASPVMSPVRPQPAELGERMSLPGAVSSAADGRRHVLVGVEGSSMTVLHERLPFVPYEGCWIRYKRFGAYTNSLASNDISEAKARKTYFWCMN